MSLYYPSTRFCTACQNWEKYDEQEMSVVLRPVRRADLPFYLFPDGQAPKSKKKAKRAQEKPTESAGENSDSQGPSKRSK